MEGISANWRTSSYSGSNGGQCVEVANAPWRTNSYSGPNGGACVEVGTATCHAALPGILVRDTTDRSGPVLPIGSEAWRALTAAIRAGRAVTRP